MNMCPNAKGNQDSTWIETEMDPHANASDPATDKLDVEAPDPPVVTDEEARAVQRIRITMRDLRRYKFSDNCKKCRALQAGKIHTNETHSEACRLRIYGEWEANNDPKWKLAKAELGFESTGGADMPNELDSEMEGLERLDHPSASKSTARSSSDPLPGSGDNSDSPARDEERRPVEGDSASWQLSLIHI